MGILNLTPDSFSDGGQHADPEAAGVAMLEAGADIIDIGGESTRPGAEPVSIGEEQRRILPVIAALANRGARISVDTRNAITMISALDDGAEIINDVSGLSHDPQALSLLARRSCPIVLMHMRGTPQTMTGLTHYDDVVADVKRELQAVVARAEAAGIARHRMVIDPGFGFAKTPEQSLVLLARLRDFGSLGLPILAGTSRKGFVGQYSGQPEAAARLAGSLAATLFALQQGASILRVHDVAETVEAVRMWQAIAERGKGGSLSCPGPEP